MKILQVFDFFSPHGGGISAVVYKLSKALADRGNEVTIYSSDYRMDKDYNDSVAPVKVFPFKSKLDIYGFHYTPDIKEAVKSALKDFDVIHFQCYTSYGNIVIRKYADLFGVPYILDAHGTVSLTHRKFRKWAFNQLFGKKMINGSKKLIAETEVGVQEYLAVGAKEEDVVIVPCGFDTEEYARLPEKGLFRKKYNIDSEKILLFLGRMHEIKGIDFIIRSFSEILKKRTGLKLVLIGPDDGYEEEMKKLADELGISEEVLFAGFVSLEDKQSALVDADLVVQTSRYEQGIAWTSLEAILCNKPVIVSSNTGAGEDIQKMGGGYLVDFGNEDQLVRMILDLIENPDSASETIRSQKDYIENNLSLKKQVIEYEKIYLEAIEQNG